MSTPKKKITQDLRTRVDTCPRCGEQHRFLPYAFLKKPMLSYFDAYAVCPNTSDPLMLHMLGPETSCGDNCKCMTKAKKPCEGTCKCKTKKSSSSLGTARAYLR